jgi:cytochrome b561
MTKSPESARYTRVAVFLHWAIALFIIFNLVLGLVMDPFKGPERYYILTVHQSVGMTVLLLTVVRVVWRLMNPPPPYPEGMPAVERHAAALVHFLLYAAMVMMPLSGWFMISANPPAGSAGEQALFEMITGKFGMRGFEDEAGGATVPNAPAAEARPAPAPAVQEPALRPKPRVVKFWFVLPLEKIGVLEQLGETRDGFKGQDVIHEYFLNWHVVSAWLMMALLILHVLGALKHQYFDRHPSMQRMGVGRME